MKKYCTDLMQQEPVIKTFSDNDYISRRQMINYIIQHKKKKVSPLCLKWHSNNRKIMNMIPATDPTINSTRNEELSELDKSGFTAVINNNY